MKRTIEVRHLIEIEIDETKFTEEFIEEFNSYMFYTETPEEHMKHIVEYYSQFDEPYEKDFLEGYGPINEMGIKLKLLDTETEIV